MFRSGGTLGSPQSTEAKPRVVDRSTPPRAIPNFLAHLKTRRVILVELDAPRTTDIQKFIRSIKQLQQAGADAITIGDSPLATMRMDGFMLASLVAPECDIELVCHLACRDRNAIATQGLLLGADATGVRNILAITGDLVDGTVPMLGEAVSELARLSARHGVVFVTGNHEYYSGVEPWLVELRRLGIRVLGNELSAFEKV